MVLRSFACGVMVVAVLGACTTTGTGPGGLGGGGSGGSGSSGGQALPPGQQGGATTCAADIAGTWGITGSCGTFSCDITQNGCSTNFSCANGAASYTGSINGNDVSYSGAQGSCQGTISGSTISGTCMQQSSTCSYTATRVGGSVPDAGGNDDAIAGEAGEASLTCPAGMVDCSGTCVDEQVDSNDCGGCGIKCTVSGQSCLAGHCTCLAGYAACSGACVDLQTDPNNCGKCGTACNTAIGQSCHSGVCVGGTASSSGA